MSESNIQSNADCKHDQHDKHLCYLMYEGFHYEKPDEYRAMVQNAQFRCQNCGRTAASETNLCSPVKI